ncbi:hypothetical protein OG206_05635 [Streptomyces sp. NBC_01341]|uniref:hypothetical protein n=1 Tax=Streptomyces sp. NBC_01341 TaxID=2903831 RepID=UPI002E1517FA|nr:hypothetical protein OG206_05635 [Streptomyces sp. NBC_01341]
MAAQDSKDGAGLPSTVVDCALYESGRRVPGQVSLDTIMRRIDPQAGRFAWIGLYEPTAEQFQQVPKLSTCTPLPSRTPYTPTSVPSWNATATCCSWS